MSENPSQQNEITAADALQAKNALKNVETPFEIHELFFSRTDDRGIIKAGNDVFERVSGLSWEQLKDAPHKIVRHPDMPKAVFYFMWDQLKRGRTVGAYIKNLSADGSYYWVLAIVTPVDGGYLSVRLKPSSDLFPKIRALYSDVLENEKKQQLSPEDSYTYMERKLNEMGYENYLHFCAVAGDLELSERRKIIGREDDRKRKILRQLGQQIRDIQTTSSNVFETCEIVRTLPTNLQIRSTRLGSSAAPIGIIASDCSERTEALMGQMREISNSTEIATRSVRLATLNASVVEIQGEILELFRKQAEGGSSLDFEGECERLQNTLEANTKEMRLRLDDVSTQIHQFAAMARSIKQAIVGMNVTRIMSTIESNILGDADGGIRDIIANLDMFQQKIPSQLAEIEQSISAMRASVGSLMETNLKSAA